MNEEPLAMLVGGQLDMVSFVQDYVELRVDYSIVRALTGPTGSFGGLNWRFPDEGSSDLLRRYIGREVSAVEVAEDHLALVFDSETRIDISLRPEDRVGAEAAHFVPALPNGQLDVRSMWVW